MKLFERIDSDLSTVESIVDMGSIRPEEHAALWRLGLMFRFLNDNGTCSLVEYRRRYDRVVDKIRYDSQ